MTQLTKISTQRLALTLILLIALFGSVPLAYWWFGLMFNSTSSIPLGLYQITHTDRAIQPGDIISFCLPAKVAKYAFAHNYLASGDCDGRYQQLAKKVIAVPGDTVVLSDDVITAQHQNNLILEYSTPILHEDAHHHRIKKFIKNGTYIAKGYWVYGDNNVKYSFDSRYYGEVSLSLLQHRLTPLLTL